MREVVYKYSLNFYRLLKTKLPMRKKLPILTEATDEKKMSKAI